MARARRANSGRPRRRPSGCRWGVVCARGSTALTDALAPGAMRQRGEDLKRKTGITALRRRRARRLRAGLGCWPRSSPAPRCTCSPTACCCCSVPASCSRRATSSSTGERAGSVPAGARRRPARSRGQPRSASAACRTFMLEERVPERLGQPVRVPITQLPSGQKLTHRYSLRCTRRGVYEVGPLVAVKGDPLGLTQRETVVAEPFELLVHPRIEIVSDRPLTRQFEDPPIRPPVSKPWPSGLEFYGMREYVPGDDLRRIVWRASARTGKIMVREAEQGITDHITIILDTDRGSHSRDGEGLSESFEAGVRAAAPRSVSPPARGLRGQARDQRRPAHPAAAGRQPAADAARRVRPSRAGREPLGRRDPCGCSATRSATPTTCSSRRARPARSGAAEAAAQQGRVDPRGRPAVGRGERRDRRHGRRPRLPGRRACTPGRTSPPPCSTTSAPGTGSSTMSTITPVRTRRRSKATCSSTSTEEAGHVEADIESAAGAPEDASAAGAGRRASPSPWRSRSSPPPSWPAACSSASRPASTPPSPACSASALAVVANRQRRLVTTLIIVGVGIFGIGALMVVPDRRRQYRLAGQPRQRGEHAGRPAPARRCRSSPAGTPSSAGSWASSASPPPGWRSRSEVRRSRSSSRCRSRPSPASACPKDQQSPAASSCSCCSRSASGCCRRARVSRATSSPPVGYEVRRALRALPLIAVVTVALHPAEPDRLPVPEAGHQPGRAAAEAEDGAAVEGGGPGPVPRRRRSCRARGAWAASTYTTATTGASPPSTTPTSRPSRTAASSTPSFGEGVRPTSPSSVSRAPCCRACRTRSACRPRASSPAFDYRSNNIRLATGTLKPGQKYTVLAAGLPTIDELRSITERGARRRAEVHRGRRRSAARGRQTCSPRRRVSKSQWDTFDFLRNYVLDNVVAAGQGVPVCVTPAARRGDADQSRGDALRDRRHPGDAGALDRPPVAHRLRLRRRRERIGRRPSRCGPKNGATFVEVYFPGFKWVPVIGTPKKAKPSVSSDPGTQQTDPNILPSDDVTIQVFLPVITPPKSVFGSSCSAVC